MLITLESAVREMLARGKKQQSLIFFQVQHINLSEYICIWIFGSIFDAYSLDAFKIT